MLSSDICKSHYFTHKHWKSVGMLSLCTITDNPCVPLKLDHWNIYYLNSDTLIICDSIHSHSYDFNKYKEGAGFHQCERSKTESCLSVFNMVQRIKEYLHNLQVFDGLDHTNNCSRMSEATCCDLYSGCQSLGNAKRKGKIQ